MHDAMDLRLPEADKARLWQQILLEAEEDAPPQTEVQNMKNHSMNKIIRIGLLAAVIASFLAVGAYAAGFLGPRAIVIEGAAQEDGSTLVSIS